MEFENWITQVSDYLPSFTVRIFLVSLFFVWISISLIFWLVPYKKKKRKIPYTRYLIPSSLLLSISIAIYLLYTEYLSRYFGNNLLYILLPVLILSLSLFTKYLLRVFKKKKVETIFCISEIVLISIATIAVLIFSLFTVPHVSLSGKENVVDSGSVKLTFTSPLRDSDLRITISPESRMSFEYEYFLGIRGLVESITIVPQESFLPMQKVVIYTTGIQRIFPWGTQHENSQEFFTPRSPEIEEIVLGTDTQNVSIEQPITIDLDINDQKSVEWSAEFKPHAEYEIQRDLDDTLVIQPKKLKQGTTYNLQIIKSIIRYNPLTLEKLSTESQEVVEELTFKTIPAPGIKGYNRSSGYISNSKPLEIDFSVALKEESLKDRVKVSPQIDGDISLSKDGKQLIFTPKSAFAKNTEYTFTLLKGIENVLGGYTEDDISISFKTPGVVSLLYSSPRNWSTNISISTSTISLTFNQPVEKSSVEDRFNISPNVNGTFSWSGNTLYYKLSTNLSYGTKYTVSISKGIKAIYGIDSSSTISTSFTTKYQTFLLKVPYYGQQESFTCNIAATRMVLAYKGRYLSESSIKSGVGIGLDPNADWVDKYGVHWGPISSYISSRGVSNSVKRGWNLTSALREVKSGHPVLVYVYNGRSVPKGAFELEGGYTGYKGMHSEVIVGYIGTPEAPQTVITHDPWLGKRYHTPNSFKYYWSYLNYTGIVIY